MVFLVDDQGVPSVASIVQVPVGGGDQTAPSAPGNLTATGQLGGVRLNWSASTDNVGVVEYRVHRSTTAGFTPSAANRVATVGGTTTTYTDSGLAAGTYHYVVVAADAAGNTTPSAQASGTAQADTTAPTVSLSSPTAGATVSGVASVAATASDDVGVQSVQFKLDGANLGAADTTAPYSFNWDTRTASNASHSLTAVAVDAAGNQTTSTAVTVTVDNPTGSAGLVAAYGFEEGTGTTTADQTGLGHTGTVSGALRSATGKFGRALTFDGVNDWVTVADQNDLDLTTAMTVEAWVYPTATTNAWRTVLAKEQNGGLAYAMMANSSSGRPYGLISNPGEQLAQGSAALPPNAWSHMATTYDGSAVRLYVNGTLVATTPAIGSIATGSDPLHFGGNTTWGEWFQGTLDDIRIYNRTLTAGEIQTDMNAPAGQPAPTDTTPPSAPGNLTATDQLGGVRLNWTASTDNVGVTEYRVHRSTTAGFTPSAANRVATLGGTTTTYTDTGLAAGTYYYVVVAADAAGNTTPSAQASGTAQADTTAPTVSLSSPAAGSTVSGVVSVAATASDDVGVQSVQFKLDGANLGAPDTTAPYGLSWDTRTASNASHSLSAVAVDAAGNQTTSSVVPVTVNNPTGAAGLVAAYGFSEASGTTTADQTGLGHTGTVSGALRSTTREVRPGAHLRRHQRLGHGRRPERPRPDHRA